jgi:4-amino-4-deoxy-L-arabinose transferase-like glycosyltransferase
VSYNTETAASEAGTRSALSPIWSYIAACALAAFYLCVSLHIATHRLFWFDEVTTIMVSRMPSFKGLIDLLRSGVDQQPLTYYLLVRFSEHLFGPSELAARIPSALGFAAGLLVTFDCARRLTDNLHGLLAPALLTCSVLPYYGFEARPYALFFMFSACSLWLWLHTERQSKTAAVSFGLSICAAIATHYYALLNLVPYTAIMVLQGKQPWRSPKLIAGFIGAGATIVLFAPLAASHRQFSAGFWAAPTLEALSGALSGVYSQIFSTLLFSVACAVIWVVSAAPYFGSNSVSKFTESERLAWLFLLIPLGGFILARLVTNAFTPRYFIGVLPGIAVGFSSFTWRHLRAATLVSLGIVCIFMGNGVLKSLAHLHNPEEIAPIGAPMEIYRLRKMLHLESEIFNQQKRKLIVVMSGDHLALEIFHYSAHPERYMFLPDITPTSNTIGVQNFSRVYPIHLCSLEDVRQRASEIALIDPPEDTMNLLEQKGAHIESLVRNPLLPIVYLK